MEFISGNLPMILCALVGFVLMMIEAFMPGFGIAGFLGIVLEVIAEAFEYDRIYTEREVNIIIADFHDDFCTIRRNMVGEGLLARDTSGYWRVKPE